MDSIDAETLSPKVMKTSENCNFYPIVTRLININIGIEKLHISSNFKLYESHRSGYTFPKIIETS